MGRCNRAEHSIKIIYRERNMHGSDVARPKIDMLSIGWCELLEQLNFMTIALENDERDFRARHSGDFTGEIFRVVRAVRQLETENIAPERQRPIEVRDRDPGVICGDDPEWRSSH